jgi:ketosteroid isomerase-like protein
MPSANVPARFPPVRARCDNAGTVSQSNVELVRSGYEAAARGDFDTIASMLAPDVKWHGGDPSAPEACHNQQEALAFMQQAHARGRLGELVDVVDAGERVVVILRPRPAPGEQEALSANVTTFRDGKVVEMVHYPSPDDALAAVRPQGSP